MLSTDLSKNLLKPNYVCGAVLEDVNESLRPKLWKMIEQFSAERHRAQEALVFGGNIFRRELTTKEDSL